MSNDLLFPILPREGRVSYAADEAKVEAVRKEERLHDLNEQEDREFSVEEREARERYYGRERRGRAPEEGSDNANQSTGAATNKQIIAPFRLDLYV